MEVIKKITIIAVLVASSAMFSFANGQVEGLSDNLPKGYWDNLTEAEQAKQTEATEAYNQYVKTLEADKLALKQACSEAEDMAKKSQKLLIEEESKGLGFKKSTSAALMTRHSQIMSAWSTFYQAFCKE